LEKAFIGGDEASATLGDEVEFVRHNALQSLVALLGRGVFGDVRAATRDSTEYKMTRVIRSCSRKDVGMVGHRGTAEVEVVLDEVKVFSVGGTRPALGWAGLLS
jgi:hypothetical protein